MESVGSQLIIPPFPAGSPWKRAPPCPLATITTPPELAGCAARLTVWTMASHVKAETVKTLDTRMVQSTAGNWFFTSASSPANWLDQANSTGLAALCTTTAFILEPLSSLCSARNRKSSFTRARVEFAQTAFEPKHFAVQCRNRHFAYDIVRFGLVSPIDDPTLGFIGKNRRRGRRTVVLLERLSLVDLRSVQHHESRLNFGYMIAARARRNMCRNALEAGLKLLVSSEDFSS